MEKTNNSNKPTWTKDQQEALEKSGALLVSASAGSGKTTVMIERIMRYLKSGGKLRRLLVLTFSRASAADMKDKLVEKLYEAIRMGDESAAHLREQIKDLPFAWICTIDSFCYDIYNRYFEKIGGEAGLTIMEPEEAELLFGKCCEDMAEEAIAAGDEKFKELYKRFRTNRGYDLYYRSLQEVKEYLAVRAEPEEFMKKVLAIAELPPEKRPSIAYLFNTFNKRLGRVITDYHKWLGAVKEFTGPDGQLTRGTKDTAEKLAELLELLSRQTSFKDLLVAVQENWPIDGQFRTTTKGCAEFLEAQGKLQVNFKLAKALIEDFVKKYKCAADGKASYEALLRAEYEATKFDETYIKMFQKCYERYSNEKRENGKTDFADMEQWALKILAIPEVREEVAAQIEKIFLDEYQDTNYLQEKIISLVSGNNTFMVGDVKQSIYAFRHAEPKIFDDRLCRYESGEQEGSNVYLNANFRSAKGVLDFVNLVFSNVMTYDFGQVDYREKAMLTAGKDYEVDADLPAVSIAEFQKPKDEITVPPVYNLTEAPTEGDSYGEEPKYVAQKIISLVGQKKIWDNHLGAMRFIEYKDIAVLVRKRAAARPFISAFKDAGIKYVASGFSDDSESGDIELLVALLKVVDNIREDIPLVAVMRSPIGGYSENELVNIRKRHPNCSFWEAVLSFSEEDAKTNVFVTRLRKWAMLAHTISVAELLSEVIAETGFDAYLISTDSPERITAVNTFIGTLRGKEFAQSIDKYLAYLAGGGKTEVTLPPSGENAVVFNTMHGSKGLEYPVVFVVDLASRSPGDKRKVFAEDELGLSLGLTADMDAEDEGEEDVVDAKGAFSIAAHKQKRKETDLLADLRLLYVTFTRARYHLFISYTGLKKDGSITVRPENATTPAEWLKMIAMREDGDGEKMTSYYEEVKIEDNMDVKIEGLTELPEGIPLEVPYKYPYISAVETGNKLSVSDLNRESYEDGENGHIYVGLGSQNAHMGTLYHGILEKIDFNVSNFEEFAENVKKLTKNGDLPPETAEIDLSVFRGAAESYVFKTARGSRTLREQPFMLYLPAGELGAGDCEDKVLLQGVIDLVILGEKNVLVDYKFTGADENTVKKRYTLQINTYAKAVERLLKIRLDERVIYVVNQDKCIKI